MTTVKNILVLTDFSENAKTAEKYALQLAIKTNANLILYNAYPFPPIDAISGSVIWPHDTYHSMELLSISNLQSRVDELNEEVTKSKDDTHKPAISHLGDVGNVTGKLKEVVSNNHIWITIMGTKGEGFANNLVFGSNVFNVLDAINCPVLIIPKNAELKVLNKIAYATDLRSTDLFIVQWLDEFCESLNAELLITHVVPDFLTDQEFALSSRIIEKIYDSKFMKIHTAVFQGKNIAESLHEIMELQNVGLLAMHHRRYGFFDSLFHKSTSHKMIKHTEIPVLVFSDSDLYSKP